MTETAGQAAKSRRRWISIGETVGILALILSGIGLYETHQERAEKRAAASSKAVARVATLVLTASADADGTVLQLASPDSDRVIQTQTIVFPTVLGIDSVDTIGNPRIEADWFAAPLRKAVGDDETDGRKAGRLPVAIITRYTDTKAEGGIEREDIAIYDIGHGWRSRLLQSDFPVLEGITRVARASGNPRAALDARWARLHPAKG